MRQTLLCGCEYDSGLPGLILSRCKSHHGAGVSGETIVFHGLQAERDSYKASLIDMASNEECGGEGGGDEWTPCPDLNCANCQGQAALDRAAAVSKKAAAACSR